MGSNRMKDSMIFMMYADSTGTKVTLSPRIGNGNYEPAYTKEFVVEMMPGSGIANNIMTANVRCQDCQVWSGGKIDSSNTKAPFIFARGPDGDFRSNSVEASVKRHAVYGSFTLDLTKAMGSKAVPIAEYADRAGTVQLSQKGDRELGPPFHAVFMLFVFVGLLPGGIMILRILNRPTWHGINQAISVLLALVGVGLGFYIGAMYQRVHIFFPLNLIYTDQSLDTKFYICSSDLRHHYHSNANRPVCHRLPTSPYVEAYRGTDHIFKNTYMARPYCDSRRHRQWLSVSSPYSHTYMQHTNVGTEVFHSP